MNRLFESFAVLRRRRRKRGPEQTETSAVRALRGLSADEFLDELFGRELFLLAQTRSRLDLADFQLFLLSPAGQKTKVPDLHKTGRQNVQEEPPDKFVGAQCHLLPTAAVAVITPLERDDTVFDFKDSVIGNGHPMGISAKIFHNTGGVLKRRFAVDHPLLRVKPGEECLKCFLHGGDKTWEAKLISFMGFFQKIKELPPE